MPSGSGGENTLQRMLEDGYLHLLEDEGVIFSLPWSPEVFLAYKLFHRDAEVAQALPIQDHNFDIVALYLASLDDRYYQDILQWSLLTENIWLATKSLIFNEAPYVSETLRRLAHINKAEE